MSSSEPLKFIPYTPFDAADPSLKRYYMMRQPSLDELSLLCEPCASA